MIVCICGAPATGQSYFMTKKAGLKLISGKTATDEFPIVGVGGSAGGFEAFSRLLHAVSPKTGMAYIFIQHLDPNFESIAPELLAKTTAMRVQQATEGLAIAPDHVYIMPPSKTLRIMDGHLTLEPRSETRGRHMPIDEFFRSVAEVHGNRAIGVVLSGTGSDGTLGLKAIKAEGGITFAQDPASSKYDGMPRSAISAECVDFTLPPERIAEELGRLGAHPYVREAQTIEKTAGLDEPFTAGDGFERIFALLKKASGVDFKYYKHTTIRRRVARRMVVHKLEKLPDYIELLEKTPAEVEALYQDILIKVTRFFRDPEVFDFLKSSIFPKLFENRKSDAPVRIWVPGCSTGEEVYSIAICLLEFLGDQPANPFIQIFATDVSELAVQTAREGKYLENIANDVSQERLRRFFMRTDGCYQISKPIRDMCIFAKQNMTSDPPFSKLDLISCRNVLIYLDARLQKRVIPVFHYALKATGFLMLGPSETVGSFTEQFLIVDKNHKVYSKKAGASRAHVDFGGAHAGERPDLQSAHRESAPPESWSIQDAQRDADRIILSRYSAAGVVVDSNMEIIQFRGDTSRYLEHPPGEPSLNLLKLARDGLGFELRSIIHEAKSKSGNVVKDNIVIEEGGKVRTVRIEASPLHVAGGKGYFFLVLFEERNAEPSPPAPPPPAPDLESKLPVEVLQRRASQLTAELSTTKQHLQSIIEEQEAMNEELQSANEEVLSSNEELQSTNEELETAKEELQSTNEELTTVNEELQHRNTELNLLNNDLTNLLSSVNIPIVMLGSDLRIRRFTPQAEKLFSLIPSDIGRPISDINPRIEIADLPGLVIEMMDSMIVKDIEVQDKDGHWYSMRIRPYKTRENKIDGAVIVLVDIDVMKRSMLEAKETRSLSDSLFQFATDPMTILNQDFVVMKANKALQQRFKLNSDEIDGASIFAIGNGQWNFPEFRAALEEVVRMPNQKLERQIEHTFKELGKRKLNVHMRRYDADGKNGRILVVIEGGGINSNPLIGP